MFVFRRQRIVFYRCPIFLKYVLHWLYFNAQEFFENINEKNINENINEKKSKSCNFFIYIFLQYQRKKEKKKTFFCGTQTQIVLTKSKK